MTTTPPVSDEARERQKRIALVVAATALAAALRLWGLGEHSVWLDEVNALQDSDSLFRALTRTYHPPLYYLTLWAFTHAFGDSAFIARLPSALAGVLVVPLAFAVAREVTRRTSVAFVASLLVAVLPVLVWHSREARMYSLWSLLVLVALWGVLGLDDGARLRRGRLAAFWLGLGGAALTHHYTLFFALGLSLSLWLLVGARPLHKSAAELRRLLVVLAPLLVAAAAVLLVLLRGVRQGSVLDYLASRARGHGPDDVVTAACHLLLFDNWVYREHGTMTVYALGAVTLGALAFATVTLCLERGAHPRRSLALAAAFWLPFLLIPALPIRGYTRLLTPSAPLLAVLLAWLLCLPALRFKARGAPVSVVLALLLAASLLPHVRGALVLEIEPWNEVCARIDEEERAGDIVLVNPGYMAKPFLRCFRGDAEVQRVPNESAGIALEDAGRLVDGRQGAWLIYARGGKGDRGGVMLRHLGLRFGSAEKWYVGPQLVVFRFLNPRNLGTWDGSPLAPDGASP